MKVAIYSRKSVYSKTGDSIENQIDLCKDYYTRMSGELETEFVIYEDDGFSGKNTQRPQFQKLLNDIKAKKVKALICYRLDRISRNVADFSTTLDLLQKYNVDFISIREQFDTSTPMGRAMIHIASVFAQLERETIAERVRDNMIELAKTGRWLGGTPPLGFDALRETYLTDDLKEKSLSKFIFNDEELKVVKFIYDNYLETHTLNEVVRMCMQNNYMGKQGGFIEKSGLSNILQNPAYVKSTPEILKYLESIGYSVYGVPNGNGILRYSQDSEDKIATVSIHPGIIEADDWLEVQRVITLHQNPKDNFKKSNTAILTGILKCGKCGSNMIVKFAGGKTKGPRQFYYVCSNKVKSFSDKCNCKNLNGDLTEELISDAIIGYDERELLEKLREMLKKHKKHVNNDSKDIEKNIESIEQKIKRLLQKLALIDDTDISKLILSQIQEYKNEVTTLKNQAVKTMDEEINDSMEFTELENVIDSIRDFKKLFNHSTVNEKRKLLATIVEKIVWDEETGDLNINYKLSKKK